MIHQGHPYKLGDVKVIALESSSGQTVRVGIVDELGWFSQRVTVNPEWLDPLPLRYLGGSDGA